MATSENFNQYPRITLTLPNPVTCMGACVPVWLSSYALGLTTSGLSSNSELTGKLSTSSHTNPPSCNGDLDISGVQIHLPLLIHNQQGSSGTFGAHTHKLRVLASPSGLPGSSSKSLLALAHSDCLVHRHPDYVRCA